MIGGTLLTMISGNLINSLVSGTIDILYSSAAFVKHGSEANQTIKDIRYQIEELDLKIKLELVQSILSKYYCNNLPNDTLTNDTNHDNINPVNINPDDKSIYTKIIESGLIDIIYKIKSLLEWVDFEINKHQLKWFSNYRSISLDDKIKDLRHYTKILDGRINILLNLQ